MTSDDLGGFKQATNEPSGALFQSREDPGWPQRLPDLKAALDANSSLANSSPMDGTADIIVPIHNAGAQLKACLISLARHTNGRFRLILIDDGSTDTAVRAVLEIVAKSSQEAIIIRHSENDGFVASINEGLARSTAPYVVILNSDAVVTRGWLEKLVGTAESRPNVATVTPLTNNGTVCSVPDLRNPGGIPLGHDADTFAALVEARSQRVFPETPTGVGFCMLITRQALARIGSFDAEAFGRGYGEENDFCQRAIRLGFVNLIADHAFVFHAGGASFGDDSNALIATHLEIIRGRYPNYDGDIQAFYQNDPLAALRADLASEVSRLGLTSTRRLRVLHVLHRGGGTEIHARDLATTEDPDVVSYVSSSSGSQLDVDEYAGGVRGRSWTFPLEAALGDGSLRDEGYRRAITSMCRSLGIDVIHVHHLLRNTLDIADVAAALGIRYALTLHDYFMLCPSYTLLDPAAEPCGACVGRTRLENADACLRHAGQSAAPGSIATRQGEMQKFLDGASRLFAPNARVVDIFVGRFPNLRDRIQIVEHGHRWTDRRDQTTKRPRRERHGQLNVAMIGGLEPHKGLAAARHLLRANQRKGTVFHLYGWTPDGDLRNVVGRQVRIDGSAFVYHGPYEADTIVPTLMADGIDVGLHLAVWEETFSFTLSEFAAAGIPVIAGELGAQGERVRRCHLGWTVADPKTPGPILEILDEILAKPETLDTAVAAMRVDLALPNLNAMWKTYAQAYREIAPEQGKAMNQRADDDRLLNRDYVLFLASRHVQQKTPNQTNLEVELTHANAEITALRERLRSPRHRVADSAANLLQKIPVIWPIVARITDAIVRRESSKK
jgi:GT2 family glycosyltransferase